MPAFLRPAIAVALLAFGLSAAAEEFTVQVRDAPLRAEPMPFGKVIGTLRYGERVDAQESQRDWRRIKASSRNGWVHLSALTEQSLSMQSGKGGGSSSASSQEVALAGKGFNADVEASYRKNNKLDYHWLDRMEKMGVSESRLLEFARKGDLTLN